MILGDPADTNPISMPPPKCGKCGGDMHEGFLPDSVHGLRGVPIWVVGKPDLEGFGGARIEGKEAHSIRTFRCTKCGYLESYAPGSP